MKTSVNTNSLKKLRLSDVLDIIKSLKCKYVELSTDQRLHAYSYISDQVPFDMELKGLEVVSVSGGWCDFSNDDCGLLTSQVDLCRKLSCNKLRLFATNPHRDYDYRKIFTPVVSNIKKYAQQYPDIFFLFENHGGLTATGKAALALLEDVDLPNVGAVYDPTNYFISGEDPVTALRCLNKFIKHVHAKNCLNGRFSSVEKGEINWRIIVKELRQIGFNGFLSIEYEGEGDPVSCLRSSLDYLNGLV